MNVSTVTPDHPVTVRDILPSGGDKTGHVFPAHRGVTLLAAYTEEPSTTLLSECNLNSK